MGGMENRGVSSKFHPARTEEEPVPNRQCQCKLQRRSRKRGRGTRWRTIIYYNCSSALWLSQCLLTAIWLWWYDFLELEVLDRVRRRWWQALLGPSRRRERFVDRRGRHCEYGRVVNGCGPQKSSQGITTKREKKLGHNWRSKWQNWDLLKLGGKVREHLLVVRTR